jgi:hypothetical protein
MTKSFILLRKIFQLILMSYIVAISMSAQAVDVCTTYPSSVKYWEYPCKECDTWESPEAYCAYYGGELYAPSLAMTRQNSWRVQFTFSCKRTGSVNDIFRFAGGGDKCSPETPLGFDLGGDNYPNQCVYGLYPPDRNPQCIGLKLELTGADTTAPAGSEITSTSSIIAKVTSNNTPKAGITVNMAVTVADSSGGHDHIGTDRPKGTLNKYLGVTDTNGEVKFTFFASQIAGIHRVSGSCANCANSPQSKDIQVKIPNLLDIFNLPFRDSQWAYPGIGQVAGRHSDNHYLTLAAATRLLNIARKYSTIWPNAPKLTLNDASLVWGGKFDIPGTWERNPRAHAEHRIGENIDIRANAAPGAVPPSIRAAVYRWLRKASSSEDDISSEFAIESVNPLRESIGETNEHFHLRLGN